jgi:chemotaxis protein CheX
MPDNGSAEDQTRWTTQIDDAVGEVFELMLRQPCSPVDGPSGAATTISARIEFAGTLEGHCVVHVSAEAADRLTDALLGSEGDWDDEMIDDAVGELCNMVAGGWKSRLGAQASACHLSVPAVSRGLAPERRHNATTTRRFYAFNEEVLEVALALN